MTTKIIQIRKKIYIAVEGESEQSFIKWLQQLSNEIGLHVHLDCQILNGGGYRKMLAKAVDERKRKDRHKAKVSILLVDSDRGDKNDDGWSIEELKKQALKKNIYVCLQRPNFEGMMFRMFPGNQHLNLDQSDALKRLKSIWVDYEKPADARTLSQKFNLTGLLCVAEMDIELRFLLNEIGFTTTAV